MDLGENTSQHKSNSKPDIPKYDDPFIVFFLIMAAFILLLPLAVFIFIYTAERLTNCKYPP